MKKLISALTALLLALVVMTGCSTQVEDIEGSWVSGDGSVLTLDGGMLSLVDAQGGNILAAPQYPYEYSGGFLYIELGGVSIKAFEADLRGDDLTLRYTVEAQADMLTTADGDITLERAAD